MRFFWDCSGSCRRDGGWRGQSTKSLRHRCCRDPGLCECCSLSSTRLPSRRLGRCSGQTLYQQRVSTKGAVRSRAKTVRFFFFFFLRSVIGLVYWSKWLLLCLIDRQLEEKPSKRIVGFLFNYCQGVTTPSAAPCKAGRGAAAAVQSTGRARRLWADSTGPNPLHEIPISGTPYESTPSRAPHTGACAKPAPAQTGSIVWSPPLAAARGGAGVAGR